MKAKRFIELVNDVANDTGINYEPRSYSGRAMYGSRCVSINIDRGDSECSLIALIMKQVAENAITAAVDSGEDAECAAALVESRDELRELVRIFEDTRTDSLGLGSIVYWPNLTWPKELNEDACPGCGCEPGDGRTEGCTHPDGCGFTG